jgi:predicted tellurium resistance membrane protein TerC
MDWITDPNALIGLLTLALLEIVLNVDNIIFITILAGKLPTERQPSARRWGLSLALVTRILFLLSIAWVMRLTAPLFAVLGHEVSGRDLILIVGGLFLIGKATHEIHSKLEVDEDDRSTKPRSVSFISVVLQIMVIDIVFSIDSVITAVGMVKEVGVMITANVFALFIMMIAAGRIGDFVERHPSIKVLALAFLVMIGGNLFVEGFGYHVPKGYTYVAMAFSVAVEFLNIKMRAKSHPVHLRGPGATLK